MRLSSKTALMALLFVGMALNAAAGGKFNYITAEELEGKLKSGEKIELVDIQVEQEYAQHHIRGAFPTYSFPVKSDEEKAKLDSALPMLNASKTPIVVICPRGGGGAERAYDHLMGKGVEGSRLFILEKGQAGWKNAELTATGK